MSTTITDVEKSKRKACEETCRIVTSNFINVHVVGIGTGSTIKMFIDTCTWFLKDKVLVASSIDTAMFLAKHGLRVVDPLSITRIDVYVDGADEVSSKLDLVKGRGGAFLREKTLAYMSNTRIYIVDYTKYTGLNHLYLKPIPIEVIPFTLNHVIRSVESTRLFKPTLRTCDGKDGPVISDNGNYIVDLKPLKPLENPADIHRELKLIHGVVETGIFPSEELVDIVIVGYPDRVVSLSKNPWV